MKEEDFLLSIKESLTRINDILNDKYIDFNTQLDKNGHFKVVKDPTEKLRHIKYYVESELNNITQRLTNPETNSGFGFYLGDLNRQYGHDFEQLKALVDNYADPKSVMYKYDWGITSLLKWLYEVSNTSLGDVHADMPKHIIVTCHRPLDFASDEEFAAIEKEYDDFWNKIEGLGIGKKPKTR